MKKKKVVGSVGSIFNVIKEQILFLWTKFE